MIKNESRLSSKYKVVVDDIYEKIKSGFYKKGDKLLSEHILVEEYGFSRQTIRHSLEILEAQGILDRKRGRGTYIVGICASRARTHTIGVIVPSISDTLTAKLISGIETHLEAHGYTLMLGLTRGKSDVEAKILKSFMEKKVDGLIIKGTRSAFPTANHKLLELAIAKQIPIVFVDDSYDEFEDIVSVCADDYKAAYDLTSYLIKQGCNKIGAILKSDDVKGQRRYSGYCAALASHAIKIEENNIIWYATGDESKLEKEEAIKFFMKSFRHCEGIICQNDTIAAHVIKTMLAHGMMIPKYKMLCAFDGTDISKYCAVSITTMDHSKKDMGVLAAEKLLTCVENNCDEKSVELPMELVIRNSTG